MNTIKQITLDLEKDRHARAAVAVYAQLVRQDNPGLADAIERSLAQYNDAGGNDGMGARIR